MALRIKRGTDADRTGYTPESGEPIWTIDTNKLYIGDGATAGGILVTGSGGSGSTPGIDDTATGVVLTITDLASTFDNDIEANADIVLGGGEINGTGDINILGNITASGNFVGNIANLGSVNVTAGIRAGAAVEAPFFVGELVGSVFADDSTPLIDGVSGKILGIIGSDTIDNTELLHFDSTNTVGPVSHIIQAGQGLSRVLLRRKDTSVDLNVPGTSYGRLQFEREDINGVNYAAFIQGGGDGLKFRFSGASVTYPTTAQANFDLDGNLILGADTAPSARLEVVGNAVVTGSITAGAMLLSGSNIDTSDSSVITVTPAVTFNSDVTVENSLTVNNTLTVDTLQVTNFETLGAGTPELTSDTDILLTAGTRVEVTQSPFKVANFTTVARDLLTPQNGDIIYNTTDNKFQGYENGAWVNLV